MLDATTRQRWIVLALLTVLVLGAVLRSMYGTRLDAPTADEPWHAVAGVEYHRTGSYRLNPEHPPLVKRWVGAMMPDDFTLRPPAPLTEKSAERDMVEETWYYDNDFRAAHQAARRSMYLLSALMLLGVGLLAWRALGPAWAVGIVAFFGLEPTMSAHMPVVMTDLGLALTLTMAALAAGLAAATWQWRWIVALGLTVGLALATKHSALAGLIGIGGFCLVAAVVARERSDEPRERSGSLLSVRFSRLAKLLAAALLAVGVLWFWYGFQFHASPDGTDPFNRPLADKVAELKSGLQRTLIAFADRFHLLPRSYLWGLTDTIRAGLEGRAQNEEFLWGQTVFGSKPWYLWPSYIIIKMPLAMIALTLAGVVATIKLRLPRVQTITIAAVLTMATVHLLALMRAQGTYAGVRHALPVVAAFGVLAAATVAIAWRHRSRAWAAVAALGFGATMVATLPEPRVWEFHNSLVGGTAGAGRWFENEGLDLGQRAYEIAAFHDSVIEPSGLPLYAASYWLPDEAGKALGIDLRNRVESMSDSNIAGRYEGWFLYQPTDLLPFPNWDWDPARTLAGLEQVARMGNVLVYRGIQTVPDVRAGGMTSRVYRYIYAEGGTDWELVARRLEEVITVRPFLFTAGLELGNAYVRLGRRDDAIRAYRTPLGHVDRGIMTAEVQQMLADQVALLERGTPLAEVSLLRNPWME